MVQARHFKHDQQEGIILNAVSRCLNAAFKRFRHTRGHVAGTG